MKNGGRRYRPSSPRSALRAARGSSSSRARYVWNDQPHSSQSYDVHQAFHHTCNLRAVFPEGSSEGLNHPDVLDCDHDELRKHRIMIRLLGLFGIIVFAISGTLVAGRKRMDLFGIIVVAIVTSIGGGT